MSKRVNSICPIPYIFIGTLLVCIAAPITAFSATNMLIWPIDPALGAKDNATELWLENKGTSVATMQIRVLGWQQVNGEENYRNQQDVVASPPIVNISAGKSSLSALFANPRHQREKSRLFVS